jgi:hypothetical protein
MNVVFWTGVTFCLLSLLYAIRKGVWGYGSYGGFISYYEPWYTNWLKWPFFIVTAYLISVRCWQFLAIGLALLLVGNKH